MAAATPTASIGQIKRDISELVNRVAFGGERIVLTSRGRPKAALVSIDDLRRLEGTAREEQQRRWRDWRAQSQALAEEILARRGGKAIDVDMILAANRADLENRHDEIFGD